MKGKYYPVRHIRLDDDVWKELRNEWQTSGLHWNDFIQKIIEEYAKHKTI